MLKSILISAQRNLELKIEWYHLLEHCLVEQIQLLIDSSELYDMGIVLEAETFVDGFYIEVIFSDICDYDSLMKIIIKATKNISENKLTIHNFDVLNDEVKHFDLTDEEKILYSSITPITGQSIEELYCKINKSDLLCIEKFFHGIDYRFIYTDFDSIEVIKDLEINTITEINKNFEVYKEEPYLNGFIKSEITTTKDFILLSLLSFIVGKSNNSILDKQYLNKYNYYLGYTHDIKIYG
ncbi:TPA: hypothetical protein LWJ98_001434, partial [Listeria innocua]|nr:hypothetical protein [Listeria innocua]